MICFKNWRGHISKVNKGNSIHLLTGYEGNIKLVVPEIPTFARGEADGNG